MSTSPIFSSRSDLTNLTQLLFRYARLPFVNDSVPGAVLEASLAHVRDANVLKTYDFVDVIEHNTKIGWQVKPTLSGTPVTWKRAKIPKRDELIALSKESAADLQFLGDTIIEFCNNHALKSMETYDLDAIGYSRLLVDSDGKATYFERQLCSRQQPLIFNPTDFEWRWSTAKITKKKEQLSSLHGIHRTTQARWFGWHGLGENQLHFTGERNWWPTASDPHAVTFKLPTPAEKLTVEQFVELLSQMGKPI